MFMQIYLNTDFLKKLSKWVHENKENLIKD